MAKEYLIKKREEVIETLTPYCKIHKIKKLDYIVDLDRGSEYLRLDDTLIGCTANSIHAIINELIAYVFVTQYCPEHYIGHFEKQTLNVVKSYWVKNDEILKASNETVITINIE